VGLGVFAAGRRALDGFHGSQKATDPNGRSRLSRARGAGQDQAFSELSAERCALHGRAVDAEVTLTGDANCLGRRRTRRGRARRAVGDVLGDAANVLFVGGIRRNDGTSAARSGLDHDAIRVRAAGEPLRRVGLGRSRRGSGRRRCIDLRCARRHVFRRVARGLVCAAASLAFQLGICSVNY
jgi:hypothetical protein